MLKTKMVEGLSGIPVKPMMAAVSIKGNKLGMSEMMTIRIDLNKKAIMIEMTKMASKRLMIKFLIK